MIRILAALAILALSIPAAEAKATQTKTTQTGLFGTKLQFKKDNDSARFKNAATFWTGLQIQRY
jgi:hypothetical protein